MQVRCRHLQDHGQSCSGTVVPLEWVQEFHSHSVLEWERISWEQNNHRNAPSEIQDDVQLGQHIGSGCGVTPAFFVKQPRINLVKGSCLEELGEDKILHAVAGHFGSGLKFPSKRAT